MRSKYYSKGEGIDFSISGGTEGVIYPNHPEGEQTIVRVKMTGKYPEIGYSINERCTETLVMLSGSFRIRIDNETVHMNEGDILMILPQSKYRIEGSGEALDFITPQWDPKQNKTVPDVNFILDDKTA